MDVIFLSCRILMHSQRRGLCPFVWCTWVYCVVGACAYNKPSRMYVHLAYMEACLCACASSWPCPVISPVYARTSLQAKFYLEK